MVHIRWLPPMENELKINIDGAFHPEPNTGGWGAVIRNHKGEVKVCGCLARNG
uniref:RNase H type-1 domain-containing protein n=1 Tax=Triticum urartu TaxID=4572 RepID=A0A8R7PNS8_TRIUA